MAFPGWKSVVLYDSMVQQAVENSQQSTVYVCLYKKQKFLNKLKCVQFTHVPIAQSAKETSQLPLIKGKGF